MMSRTGKLQNEKIATFTILLKAKFNLLVKQREFKQADGLLCAIEMLEEFFAKEIKQHGEKTTIRTND